MTKAFLKLSYVLRAVHQLKSCKIIAAACDHNDELNHNPATFVLR